MKRRARAAHTTGHAPSLRRHAPVYTSLAAYCRAVGISHSTLTPQIQHLERDLRGQLLIRGQCGHRRQLTDFGEKVLAFARPYADQLGARDGQGRQAEDRDTRSATSVSAAEVGRHARNRKTDRSSLGCRVSVLATRDLLTGFSESGRHGGGPAGPATLLSGRLI